MKNHSVVPRTKVELLPVARALRDEWALEYHLSLAAIRDGHGSMSLLGQIARVLMLSNFLLDGGYGAGFLQTLAHAQDAIAAVHTDVLRSGQWIALSEGLWRPMARLLTLYDDQLSRAPSSEVVRAMQRYADATGVTAPPARLAA